MDEAELKEILASYRDAINALIERIEAQDEMVKALKSQSDSLSSTMVDEIISPAKEALDQYNYDTGLNAFTEKYGSKFDGYNDKLRPIEGEDFDVVKKAYDEYNAFEGEKPEEGVYVEELIKQIDSQLEAIRESLGVSSDSKIEVKNEDGETKVKVDGEEVVPNEGEDEIVDDSEEASNPEEVKAYEKELEKYL